jgi:hypothetical protein
MQPSRHMTYSRGMKRVLLVLLLLVAAFAGGYIPEWMEVRKLESDLRTTTLDLRLANLHRQLGVATQQAQRNNYGDATEAARSFFDECGEIVRDNEFEHEPRTKLALSSYAGSRDDILRQLALADPAVKERLAGLYLTMDGVLHRRE